MKRKPIVIKVNSEEELDELKKMGYSSLSDMVDDDEERKGKRMNKKEIARKRMEGLEKWRASLPVDKDGNVVYPDRPSTSDRLKSKIKKRDELQKKVDELNEEILKLQRSVDKNERNELIKKLSTEQLRALVESMKR